MTGRNKVDYRLQPSLVSYSYSEFDLDIEVEVYACKVNSLDVGTQKFKNIDLELG